MPQRGERDVGIHFGRISPACWERIKDQPGAIVEKAIPMLVEARSAGRDIHYRPTLKVGVSKKLWLTPETVEAIDRISAVTGLRRTPIILAALDLYFGGAPAGLGQADG
ncbi:hypothetical protein IGS68_00930 [Skermanella sp. TT6]|uniref:Ribbon-helix-helix protein CopG domain-containing protein n=1 Tax=Skermanella cutis TaxID=2775420 RepID=A0ABX7B6T9_9PROT|nr:hypothetical protein [Skermanella sp. TT6]QQP89877.1 hypothetical protein IGS68_00930 [Skermanella sp. TT6]